MRCAHRLTTVAVVAQTVGAMAGALASTTFRAQCGSHGGPLARATLVLGLCSDLMSRLLVFVEHSKQTLAVRSEIRSRLAAGSLLLPYTSKRVIHIMNNDTCGQ